MTKPDRPSGDVDLVGRLFLALPLSAACRSALTTYVRDANRGRSLPGRVVPADSWHLTLRFLGDTPVASYERLVQALSAADWGRPFSLSFDGLGAFPRPDRARVLWLGLDEGADRVRALGAVAEDCARGAGFPPETRPFSAHLTLSRLDPPADLTQLVAVSAASGIRDEVDHVAIYRSHLGRGPARYEALRAYPLR